jgi:parvulin-like peptidyl-prolyl isomerase
MAASCGEKLSEETQPVKTFDLAARVAGIDDEPITLGQLNNQIYMDGWAEHTALNRVKDTADFNFKSLDRLIVEMLTSKAAVDFNIDTILTAQTSIREHMREYVLRLLYTDLISDRVKITAFDEDTFYTNNKRMFFSPERASAGHILISFNPSYYVPQGADHSSISRDSVSILARAKMAEVLERLKDGDSFESLADEYSHDRNSARQGGSLGWVARGDAPPTFDSTLFSLTPGQLSPAIETQHGYHVVKMYEHADSSYAPLDDAMRSNIRDNLIGTAARGIAMKFADSLMNVAKITYNEKLLARDDSTYEDNDWLAAVNRMDTIFAVEYVKYANTYQMKNRLPKLTVEDKKKILGSFVHSLVLSSEAHKRGYYSLPEARQERDSISFLQARYQYRMLGDIGGWQPSDEVIKAFYDSHLDEYYAVKPLHVQHILFDDSLKAEEVRKKIADGADFKEMALKHYPGEPAVRESLCDLGYISKDEMPAAFWNAAWILNPGDVSRPVHTEYGFHIIKLVDRKPMVSYEEARERVRRRMIDEKRDQTLNAWRSELFEGHTIEIDSALLREFVYQAPEALSTVREGEADSTSGSR